MKFAKRTRPFRQVDCRAWNGALFYGIKFTLAPCEGVPADTLYASHGARVVLVIRIPLTRDLLLHTHRADTPAEVSGKAVPNNFDRIEPYGV